MLNKPKSMLGIMAKTVYPALKPDYSPKKKRRYFDAVKS